MVHDVQAAAQRAPAPLDEEASPCLAAGEDKSSLGGRPNPADGSSALPCSNPGGWKRFLVAQHSQALANWRCIARLWAKGSTSGVLCPRACSIWVPSLASPMPGRAGSCNG